MEYDPLKNIYVCVDIFEFTNCVQIYMVNHRKLLKLGGSIALHFPPFQMEFEFNAQKTQTRSKYNEPKDVSLQST